MKKIFLDDEFIPFNDILYKKLLPWRLRGRGAFETMRSYRGEIFLLDQHLKRLSFGLRLLKVPPPFSSKKIKRLLGESLKANRLQDARIRLTVWVEKGSSHVSIFVFPHRVIPKKKYTQGFKAALCKKPLDKRGRDPLLKSIDYGFYHDAYEKALQKGCDEALIVNRKEKLVEGSRTNIFFFKENVLCTPKLASGCLEGVTRQAVIRIAKGQGIKVKEGDCGLQDLLDADEAFLTNSIMEMMPLAYVDGKRIGSSKHTLTRRILRLYRKMT